MEREREDLCVSASEWLPYSTGPMLSAFMLMLCCARHILESKKSTDSALLNSFFFKLTDSSCSSLYSDASHPLERMFL